MSYTFSSATLPTGFSIVGNQLLVDVDAPAFNGVITILVTDGINTVSQTISINREVSTIAPLVQQSMELISISGFSDAIVTFEVSTQLMVSVVGFSDSFVLTDASLLLSVTGANDAFLLGVSINIDNVTASGIPLNYQFLDNLYQPVASMSDATFIKVYREYQDSAQTTDAAIGCTLASAATFRASLFDAVKAKFGSTLITFASCSSGVIVTNGPPILSYFYYTNNPPAHSGS